MIVVGLSGAGTRQEQGWIGIGNCSECLFLGIV